MKAIVGVTDNKFGLHFSLSSRGSMRCISGSEELYHLRTVGNFKLQLMLQLRLHFNEENYGDKIWQAQEIEG